MTLVSGPTSIAKPEFVHVVDVVTAKEMYEEVTKGQRSGHYHQSSCSGRLPAKISEQ